MDSPFRSQRDDDDTDQEFGELDDALDLPAEPDDGLADSASDVEAGDLVDALSEGEFDEEVVGESEGEEEARVEFFLHHSIPLPVGGRIDDGLIATQRPDINIGRARQPHVPGFTPLLLPPLPSPNVLKLIPPPGVTIAPPPRERPAARPAPRIAFPVPHAPGFERLSPAPPSPSAGTAPSAPPSVLKPAPAPRSPSAEPAAAEAPARPALRDRVDPLFALLLYLGAATSMILVQEILPAEARYTILWTLLIGIGAALTLINVSPKPDQMDSSHLVWGLGIGFIIGLPLFITVRDGLAPTSGALFPEFTVPSLFQSLVIVGPLGETIFFRGFLQEKRGIVISIIGAAVHNVLIFLPVTFGGESTVLAVAGIFFLSVLAGVYSYVRMQYGLTAAFVCQATANLMLLFLPAMLASLAA